MFSWQSGKVCSARKCRTVGSAAKFTSCANRVATFLSSFVSLRYARVQLTISRKFAEMCEKIVKIYHQMQPKLHPP